MVQRVADRVMRRRGGKEVGGDDLRALVDKLVERVLAVGSSGTPDDGLHASLSGPTLQCEKVSERTPVW